MSRASRRVLVVVSLVLFALVATACGSSSKSSSSSATTTPPTSGGGAAKVTGSITVSAAASLTQAFKKIGQQFEAANPGSTVKFNFDASSALVTQIQSGAPADVFASADQSNMTKLTSAGKIDGTPVVFAKNKLEIATKPDNPKNITGLSSLPTAGIIALCAKEVPCGKYAEAALTAAKVTIPESSITRGQNASATLGQVSQGDAVAAIVYVTDVKGAGSAVGGVTIPDDQNQIAVYPIGVLKSSSDSATAKAFADYVASPAGQSVLQSYGFLPPS